MKVFIILTFLAQTVICGYDRRIITTLKYSKYPITPTVVNGKPAFEGQFPYLVSIKEPTEKIEPGKRVWSNLCGGSIVAKKRVLTAAHCFEFNHFYYAKHPDILRVVAGSLKTAIVHSGETETTEEYQWRKIKKVIVHRGFTFPSNDIALAFIDQPWVYGPKVNQIDVAIESRDYTSQCFSAGYGRTGPSLKDTISPVLLSAEIITLPRWRCSLAWEINMDTFVCTESALTDVSMGDSGGPLVCHGTRDPNEVNSRGILVGIVSGKNYDKTTLYTRVSEYREWLVNGVHKLRVDICLMITLLIAIYLLFH